MKRVISILVIILFVLPLNSNAESESNPLKMEELAIQVMPEYSYHPKDTKKNRPPLLIGYQGTLKNHSNKVQKGNIEIPIPSNLKNIQIGFVADYSSDLSEMYEIEYVIDKKHRTVSWQTTKELQPGDLYKFVIEFYSNNVKQISNTRTLDYSFTSFTNIDLVNITFLEPLKTDSTKLTPTPENHQENPYGMNMFMYQIPKMKTGDTQTYQLTYKRSSTQTTVEIMNQIDPNLKDQPVKPKKVESNELYMIIGGVAVFCMISVFLLILFFKYKKRISSEPIHSTSLNTNLLDEKAQLRNKLIQGEISKKEYDRSVKKKQKSMFYRN